MSPRQTWMLAVPVAALLLAGCGGGGDDESTESTAVTTAAPAALTKAELIEQGDAICAEVNAAVGTVGASSAETGSLAAQVADLYSGMVDSLNSLGTPQEMDGYAEFSGAAEELAQAEGEVKLASERGDTAGLEAAESSSSSALTSFQNAASEYGFEDCSEGPSAPVTTAPEAGEAETGEEAESVEPEAVEPEAEAEPAPEVAPETGGAGGAVEGGGTGGGTEGGGGETGGGSSGGIGPG